MWGIQVNPKGWEREFDDLCKKVKNTKTLYMIIVTNSDSGGRKYELWHIKSMNKDTYKRTYTTVEVFFY